MLMPFLLLFLSFFILYFGAEITLSSAEKIGYSLGFSPLVVGLIIIGLGTSLPEFFVSHLAMLSKHPEMALGNILGSNIANLFLILGVAGLMVPLTLKGKTIKLQLNFHFALMLLLGLLFMFKKLNYISGIAFSFFFIFYLFSTFREMKSKKKQKKDELHEGDSEEKLSLNGWFFTSIKLMLGFFSLYFGGDLLVASGIKVCAYFGLSEYIIAAIFVAFGTSFPELMTCFLICIKKKNTELIIGNIIGSNVFNVAFILGSISFYGFSIGHSFAWELISLFLAALSLMFLSQFKRDFFRKMGGSYLSIYVGFVLYWVSQLHV